MRKWFERRKAGLKKKVEPGSEAEEEGEAESDIREEREGEMRKGKEKDKDKEKEITSRYEKTTYMYTHLVRQSKK